MFQGETWISRRQFGRCSKVTSLSDQSESAAAGSRIVSARSMTRRVLHERVWTRPMTTVAAEIGISRNGLAKICDRLLIPYPGRGYWSKAPAARSAPQPLPPPPAGVGERVVIAPGGGPSRRRRTRMAREARVEQLIEAAGCIVAKEGLGAASMRRVAREVGLSEAQAHNYFSRGADLLVALARRELE